jgi:hypothetical protein
VADAVVGGGSIAEAVSSWTPGDLSPELLDLNLWTDELIDRAGIPVVDCPLVTVGAGLGSFALVDMLRIVGVPASSIRVLGNIAKPYETYSYLARNSQIPDQERLRSDSGSVMDNVWGWPGYALREAFAARSMTGFIAPLFQVATEPVLTDYYTPKANQVYRSVDREMARIDYPSMLVRGQVRMVRRRAGGGYFTILTPPSGSTSTKRVAYRSTYVHLAVGYPGLRFLPDLQEYLQRTGDYAHVVNAYSPHDHVYEELRRRPGTVLVRGAGIVASRVLQRLMEDVERHSAETRIMHLFRNYQAGTHGGSVFMRRKARNGVALQGFNWPKSAWGGQLRDRLEQSSDEGRAELFKVMGGTTTPNRKLWQRQIADAQALGSYRQLIGQVGSIAPAPGDGIEVGIDGLDGGHHSYRFDFVIDCTGLEADLKEHRLLDDLLRHCGAGRNLLQRLDVSPDFEIRGTASEPGHMYASGSSTLGAYYAGVDSFLGLQYAALRITDHLAAQGFCRRLGPLRSVSQWLRWATDRPVPKGSRR